jgi:arsenate reductase (thioredoxin)
MYRVLLLCSNNSVLSPIAEGYFRKYIQKNTEVFGASIEVVKPDATVLKVLKEDGVDVSQLRSYNLSDLKHLDFDYVLTFDEESEQASHHLPSKPVKYHFDFEKFISDDLTDTNKEEVYRNICERVNKTMRSFIKEHFYDA